MLQFLNPALVFGALLFAVPLIIHLLNRQRYKRRAWAAMEYLLAAYKKQRRRVRTENLLLLILRCLIPILLALAVARPMLRDVAGVGAFAGTAHHVLVLDRSYSMGVQPEGAPSPFERTKQLAGQLLDRLDGRNAQKITIASAGVRPDVQVREDLNLSRAKAAIAQLPGPLDSAADLTATLDKVAEQLEESSDPDVRVYVFTDLQLRAFGQEMLAPAEKARTDKTVPPKAGSDGTTPPQGEGETPAPSFKDTARDALDRIAKHAEVILVDVGPDTESTHGRVDNLQITQVRLGVPHAVARVAVPVLVTVMNRTDASRDPQVTLDIDGGEPVRRTMHLEAGAEGQLEFEVTFRDVGQRRLRASLEGDALAADNERFLVVPVREQLKILLVEGSAETDPALQESEHLREILDPTRGEGTPELTMFAPKTVDSIALLAGRERLKDYQLVVLANVERLNEAAATQIKEAMQSGTGLLVMLGDHTDTESFNVYLHGAGDGPMPMRLTAAAGFQPGGKEDWGIKLARPEHPIFADFTDVYREVLQATPIYRVIGSDPRSMTKAGEVLLQVRDAELSPLLVASTYGEGRALFLTSAMSRRPDRWNRLDYDRLAFLLFHPMVQWLTLPTVDPFDVEVGAVLSAALPARPSNVAVVLPERAGGDKRPVGEESLALPGGRYSLPPFRGTDHAGIYTVEAFMDREGASQYQQLYFAVNPDPAEGDLVYASHDMVRERLGVQRIVRGLPAEGTAALESGNSEIGPLLLLATLLFLVSEAVLARIISSRRL